MSETANGEARAGTGHYRILDALRFVLAFWVAVGHYGMIPLFAGADPAGIAHLVARAWNTVVFGTPAVIVFFVISGFCIHLPFIGNEKLAVGRYYLRRYTRILIPVAGALGVYRLWGQHLVLWGEHSILWESPLWSLACEEIYYAAYPLLRLARNRFGWKKVLPVAFVAGIATALTHPHSIGWHEYGPFGTALLLLPVWLLGCLLAEQAERLLPDSSRSIWTWRFAVWFASWACGILHFKAHISYTQTMLPFGILAYFWIRREIAYGMCAKPWRPLTLAGRWSYSLYLIHGAAMVIFARKIPMPNLGYALNWCAANAFILLFSYLFFFVIERPSHRLARMISLRPAPRLVSREEVVV